MPARERAMTVQRTPPGRLASLLGRQRAWDPKRSRWRHFAPHAALVVALAVVQFFYTTLLNTGRAGASPPPPRTPGACACPCPLTFPPFSIPAISL